MDFNEEQKYKKSVVTAATKAALHEKTFDPLLLLLLRPLPVFFDVCKMDRQIEKRYLRILLHNFFNLDVKCFVVDLLLFHCHMCCVICSWSVLFPLFYVLLGILGLVLVIPLSVPYPEIVICVLLVCWSKPGQLFQPRTACIWVLASGLLFIIQYVY